jgi:hypothetical protein
LINA